MGEELHIEHMPELNSPILILGFEGWANGGNVAVGMIDYLIQKLQATRFATVSADHFYRFDDTRPTVTVKSGQLKEISPPEAAFYAARQEQTGVDVILLKGNEPHLRWFSFTELMLSLCKQWATGLIISLGGLQDRVVHTDVIISGLASNAGLVERMRQLQVIPTDYEGPGAIHSLILQQAKAMGIEGISLWGHCPFYLQGTHLRLLSQLAAVLADLTGLQIETDELEKGWMRLARQIQGLIDRNPELQAVIKEIMKSKTGGPSPAPVREDGKVIYLDDFFRPRD
jgi:proteasome assembly chaperone (PAC2) family protein